jgi:formylmethanofuran dehydrogenase subunit C
MGESVSFGRVLVEQPAGAHSDITDSGGRICERGDAEPLAGVHSLI